MKMKSTVAMLLSLLLLLSIFNGCGDAQASVSAKSGSEEETSSVAPTAEAVPEASSRQQEESAIMSAAENAVGETERSSLEYPICDETVEMSLFMSFSPMLADMIDSMNDITAYDVAEQRTNVHLDAVMSTPETTSEKFQVMIASGTYTDLIHRAEYNYSGGLDKAIDDEVLIDMNPYLDEYAPDYLNFLDSNETAKKLYTTEAGRMGAMQGLSQNFGQGAIFRQDWLDDCNLEVPQTVEELEQVLTAFKEEKGAKNSVVFTAGNIFLAGCFNIGAGDQDGTGGAVYNVIDNQVEMVYFDDAYYSFIETLARWNKNGLFSSDIVSLFGVGVADSFVQSDDCGFWYGSQDNLGSAYAENYAGDSDHFSTVAVPLMTRNAGETIDTGAAEVGGEAWSVTTSCQDPEVAVSYINWFFTEEGRMTCNYGIEGVTYQLNQSGTPEYTDLIVNNPDGLSQMQAQWLYCCFQAPFVQDEHRNDSLYSDEIQKTASSIWLSNRTDDKKYFGSLTTEEAEVYNTYASDLETYAGEQLLRFILNQDPLNEESWDAFLAKLQDMHAEEMVELKQNAYDRYLSK